MREQPPQPLIELLERLGLATSADVRNAYGRARRLARDLPLFESVWVDALVQARVLTPYQAAELNQGRGELLAVGPYVICDRLHDLGYGTTFRVRHREDGTLARITIARSHDADAASAKLEELRRQLDGVEMPAVLPIDGCGVTDHDIWATNPIIEGQVAVRWMVHNGRFPPQAVLELARQIVLGLARLETVDVLHGDISAHNLFISPDGRATLANVGLRTAVRPTEGFAHAQLRPDVYDYLAPERVANGSGPTPQSELWSLGSVCWHLLTGRTLLRGATGVEKMRASQTARFTEVARLAPGVPPQFASAISACIKRDPAARPASLARLAAILGPPTREGRQEVAYCMSRSGRHRIGMSSEKRAVPWATHSSLWVAAAAGCLVALAVAFWPQWQGRVPLRAMLDKVPFVAHSKTDHRDAAQQSKLRTEAANRIARASYEEAVSEQEPARPLGPQFKGNRELASGDLILPVGRPLRLTELRAKKGQTVRGADGGRPLIIVSTGSLHVTVEDLSFVGVDFLFEPNTPTTQGASTSHVVPGPQSLIQLHAQSASFQGCSFQGNDDPTGRLRAIVWYDPPGLKDETVRLQTGVLELTDCCLRGLDIGIDCRNSGGLVFEINNTLHLGQGPLLRMSRCPAVDEPVVVSLAHVTLRESGGLLECRYDALADPPGKIAIQTLDCVLSPAASRPLLTFSGTENPTPILRVLQWTGQGSVITTATQLASWNETGSESVDMDEEKLSIAGLVRSDVEFAKEAGESPDDSRLVSWQVPLRSTEPPGIGEFRWRFPRLVGR